MSQSHHLHRNILIISKIKNNPYVDFKELSEDVEKELSFRGIYDVGTSRRTIQRDIEAIRTYFGIDIQYCRSNKGYFIADSDIRSDIDRFLDSFDILTSLNTESGIPEFVLAEQHRPLGTQHLYSLIYATRNSLQISFLYLKFGDETPSERVLEPYAIKECRGRWYAIGQIAGKNDLRTFGLDRIVSLAVTNNHFKKDKNIDITERFKYSYGIYSSNEYPIEDIILSFDAGDGSYLKSLPLHHSQEIIKDTKDEFIIRLRLKITPDFVMEIISRSWSLKVISPLSLQEQVCDIHRAALDRNNRE